jgi:hypothetical protein
MSTFVTAAAFVGILTAAIGYGTDVFEALVQRPALARVDDATVAAVMGRIHEYGDRRLPIPGTLAILATAATTVAAAVSGSIGRTAVAGVALVALLVWSGLYVRIAAPINRVFIAAAHAHTTPQDTRSLQARWESVITARVFLTAIAVTGLALALVLS